MYRFFFHTHPKHKLRFEHTSAEVSRQQIVFVRNQLIVMTRKVAYPEEYKTANKSISSSSVLLNLNPYMSENYIIRCCGRLEASPGLPFDERHALQ